MSEIIKHIEDTEFVDQVVSIQRVSKVVKGGKNFSFSALIVVGNKKGRVGIGLGKAREVPQAIAKGVDQAKKALVDIPVIDSTIPHTVKGKYGSGVVLLKPASKGTGIIAGSTVRAIIELAGIQNILSKCLGSTNPHNVVKATFVALKSLQSPEYVAKKRGKTIEEIMGNRTHG